MAEMRHARRTRGEVEVRGKVQRNAPTQTGCSDLASVLHGAALSRNNKLATKGGREGGEGGGFTTLGEAECQDFQRLAGDQDV